MSARKLYFTEAVVDIGFRTIIHATVRKHCKGESIRVRIPPEKVAVIRS